jgi:hypothetical protein
MLIFQIKVDNMMKFAKLNHMSIITLFAIAFIVVYLYYTISDVKKIHSEVRRMGQDIDKLNQSITNITTTILPMLTFPSASPLNIPEVKQTSNVHTKEHTLPPSKKNIVEVDNEDVASVGSHELTKIMETIDVDDDIDVDIGADINEDTKYNIDTSDAIVPIEDVQENTTNQEGVEPSVVGDEVIDIGALSAEDLKKVPYNSIRKYCKLNNIDDKGSKEVLIYRIKNPPRP